MAFPVRVGALGHLQFLSHLPLRESRPLAQIMQPLAERSALFSGRSSESHNGSEYKTDLAALLAQIRVMCIMRREIKIFSTPLTGFFKGADLMIEQAEIDRVKRETDLVKLV